MKISSDIDYHTGNIDACGSVTITGSVMPNFVVKAAGDIVIQGNIESAYVEAKGSLKAAGIFGKTEATIVKAGKSLEANFLQNCHVTAKSDIHIRDSVVNSEVSSETQIDVSGGKGAVVTSRLMAGSHIVASVLGSHGENPLQLIAGVNPKLWQGLERQKRELNFTRRVALRGSYKRRRPDNALERNISVRQSKKRNYASVLERSVARREKNILSDLVLRKELPYVKASQKVYANVHIKIGPYRFKTTEESDGKIFQPDLQHAIIVAT
ncbi:MAG: DUF342 domain-containing protein [Deltaproteobacteria bacterium]|nr:MAG: DUF342 domain-containing protein [Deltaproteobacteria bacterium]